MAAAGCRQRLLFSHVSYVVKVVVVLELGRVYKDESVRRLVLVHIRDELAEEPCDEEDETNPEDDQADGQGDHPGHDVERGYENEVLNLEADWEWVRSFGSSLFLI